jgi:uncharacterized membrane protein required for colicin V production
MFAWPDLVIGGIALFFAVKGFAKGFVSELTGAVAFFVAIVAGFEYAGSFDAIVQSTTGLGVGSAHVVGLVSYAILFYAGVLVAGWLVGRLAKLPVFNIANAVGGAVVGAAKALFVAAFVLYVGLFFPLTPDLRADLHRSMLAQFVTLPDHGIDTTFRSWMPWWMQGATEPFFARHHV